MSKSIVKENIAALRGLSSYKREMNSKLQLCWRCQKDKKTVGGHIDNKRGIFKFICADCLEAKSK